MQVCRRADARQRRRRCATRVHSVSTDRRITMLRDRRPSSRRLRVCGRRCSRIMWARFRRVAARVAASLPECAARLPRTTCSGRVRALSRTDRRIILGTERQATSRLQRKLEIVAGSGRLRRRAAIVAPRPWEAQNERAPAPERWKHSAARRDLQHPATVMDSGRSRHLRAANRREARRMLRRPVAAAAAIGTALPRVPWNPAGAVHIRGAMGVDHRLVRS